MANYSDDICIVGFGCVLPEANDANAFWNNLLESHCSIRPLPDNRWKKSLYLSDNPGVEDLTYSNYAGYVGEEQIQAIGKARGIDTTKYNHMQLMALEAATQAMTGINNLSESTVSITLGCMGSDEEVSLLKFLDEKDSIQTFINKQPKDKQEELRNLFEKSFNELAKEIKKPTSARLASSAPELIKQFHDLRGEVALIDAACASSHAAIEIAMQHLRTNRADFALTGGIEGQLAPENFVLFASLGLLAKTVPHPLDASADGMAQGEGAAIFLLERLDRALANGHPIHAVIRNCAGSSNGKAASLFSPTVAGQTLALNRARQTLQREVDYIECHGTGTRVGDTTELRTLNELLQSSNEKVPVGSVKALVGHTKGTAGAAGLMKCLLAMKHRTIPPSKYFNEFIEKSSLTHVDVNQKPISLPQRNEPLLFGISSAGFGGANYHLILEEWKETKPVPRLPHKAGKVVVLAHSEITDTDIRQSIQKYDFRIPPKNLAQIDTLQLQALVAVTKALESAAIPFQSLEKGLISVLSASALGTEAAYNLSKRIRHREFMQFEDSSKHELSTLLETHKDKFPTVTEDTGPGTLNNVIAGRVCNVFDFTGKNFNVDADLNSLGSAMSIAALELQQKQSQMVILLAAKETFDENIPEFERNGITCFLLALEETAQKQNRHILYEIDDLQYNEQCLREV